MREIDPLVSEYQHEKHRPRESEALLMLRKIASLVKPVMRQRAWRVGTLCEFYPHQRELLGLNINYGQKICIRLRYPVDERQFLPMEQVVDTMLHELCHIVHGPHNEQFHALWNQLRDEYQGLILKGYTGEGFLSEGRRLGGSYVPIDEAHRLARAAVVRSSALSIGSGRKVGGTSVLRGTDMRKVIADAAQRRMEVTKGCASGTDQGIELAEEASRNGFRTKAEEDSANERAIIQSYIEFIQLEEREKHGSSYTPSSQENPTGLRTALSPPPIPESTKPIYDLTRPAELAANDASFDREWTCPTCTLQNPANFLCCDACASERPHPSNSSRKSDLTTMSASVPLPTKKCPLRHVPSKTSSRSRRAVETLAAFDRNIQKRPLGWVCHACGTFMEADFWICSSCGVMKHTS